MLVLANGDKISGRLIRLTQTQVEFLTAYAGSLRIERRQVFRLSTADAVQVDLVSGERLIGKIAITDTEKLIVESHLLGTRDFTVDMVREISEATSEGALAEVKGKGESSGESPVAKPIGEKPEEEDIRMVFLRQSSVLLRGWGEVEADLAFQYTRTRVSSLIDVLTRQLSLMPTVRVGLSSRAETFVSLPLSYAEVNVGGSGHSKAGIGDWSAGIKYLLAQESARWPDVVLPRGSRLRQAVYPTGQAWRWDRGTGGLTLGSHSLRPMTPWYFSGVRTTRTSFSRTDSMATLTMMFSREKILGTTSDSASQSTRRFR